MYVARAQAAGLDWSMLAPLNDAQIESRLCSAVPAFRGARAVIDLPTVHRELCRKGMTLLLLWQEYREAHGEQPIYQYTQFCRHDHHYAQSLRRSMRPVHRAGEKLFIVYAGQTVPLVNPDTGEMRRAHIFVAVRGASNYTFTCATVAETQADWLRGLTQAL
jgi:transposase